jgi:hypothetical protein
VQDIVIIPTFDRPEMLWLCMDYLVAASDYQYTQVRVYVDAHIGQTTPRADIETVLGKFPQLSLQMYVRPPHQYHGNSYNVLMAYKDAYDTDTRFVFLIEDDVLIHPDFFAWHWFQQTRPSPIVCSIGVLKQHFHGVYASMGVCFRRDALRMILPHCTPAYFQNMRAYCRAHFAASPSDCEQDGLFCRLIPRDMVVWADKLPLAQHVGWYGYHRKKSIRPYGTLTERYEQVKEVLSNQAILKEWMKDFYGDVEALKSCN